MYIHNFNNYVEPNLLVFKHLPKCGGITMHKMLSSVYKQDEIFSTKVLPNGELTTNMFVDLPKNNLKLFKGHLGVFIPELYLPKEYTFSYFTFIRNPVSRMLSYYNYCKKTKYNKFYNIINQNNLSLIEFLERFGDEKDICNGQSKLIASQLDENNLLENALTSINTKYFFVGIMERYEESLALLSMKIHLPHESYIVSNKSGSEKIELTIEEQNYILKRNQIDLQLYNILSEDFEKLLNSNYLYIKHKRKEFRKAAKKNKRVKEMLHVKDKIKFFFKRLATLIKI
jgi:hypothetical protein